MCVVITFENLHQVTKDSRDFTHEYVECCLSALQNLASRAVRFKGYPKGRKQLTWAQSAIRDFLDGYLVHENPKRAFDFAFFSLATEKPVEVFGEYHANYHSAVSDLFIRAVQDMFDFATKLYDVKEITPAIYRRMVAACWKATGLQPDDAEKQVQWLRASVWKEADRASIGRLPSRKISDAPLWNQDRRELSYCGQVVKKYRTRARNQEAILEAFQVAGWPARIDDPLPFTKDGDSRQRLADAVHALNKNDAILFELDGRQGVIWKVKPL